MTDDELPDRCPHCHHRGFSMTLSSRGIGLLDDVKCAHCGFDPRDPAIEDVPLHAADADIGAFVEELVDEERP